MIDPTFDLSEFTEAEQAEILNCVRDEKAKILHRRDLVKRMHFAHLNNVALLRIAADYLDWLYVNGRGSTFSTFVDEFGYNSLIAKAVFNQIGKLYGEMKTMAFPEDGLISSVDYPRPPYSVGGEHD